MIDILMTLMTVAFIGLACYSSYRLGKSTAMNKMLDALMKTLFVAVNSEALTKEEAQTFVGVWMHMMNHSDEERKCACGSTTLHCTHDEVEAKGFKHTAEFCDVL